MPRQKPDPKPVLVTHKFDDFGITTVPATEVSRSGRRVTVDYEGEQFTTDSNYVTDIEEGQETT